MVKSYLRFEQSKSFGVISSPESNSLWIPNHEAGDDSRVGRGRVVTGALEQILIWDVHTGTLLNQLYDGETPGINSMTNTGVCPSAVTSLAYHDTNQLLAAGYANGTIKIWDINTRTVIVEFNGHKTTVSVLEFDSQGVKLVSGSADCNIIVWDLIGEVGLYKLTSHRNQITGLKFIKKKLSNSIIHDEEDEWLVSISKDGLIKLWDLKTKYCVETHIASSKEAWSLAIDLNFEYIITGGEDNKLKVWEINLDNEDETGTGRLIDKGIISKKSSNKAMSISFHSSNQFFQVQNSDKSIEIFRIRSAEEIKKAVARRKKRVRESKKEINTTDEKLEIELNQIDPTNPYFVFASFALISSTTGSKIKSSNWAYSKREKSELNLIITLGNNSVEYHIIEIPKKFSNSEIVSSEIQSTIELQGHRSDPRCLSITSDDKLVASISKNEIKIWNLYSTNCIRTLSIPGKRTTCGSFLPGDALIVVGNMDGDLHLFDVASSSLIQTIEGAHKSGIWSLDISSNGKTMVTGGRDENLKFWEFKVVSTLVPGTTTSVSNLLIKHSKTLQVNNEVIAVKIDPNNKYVLASLHDNTVKVFYLDTLKFYLSLFGHKGLVLSIDVSQDSKLVITGSQDKNIKIWGLDFGDCHKSIFAHTDIITNVLFDKSSESIHNFFSCSKDRVIKYWDGDKFDQIQKLVAHHSEVWGLAASHSGGFIVSSSHDKSIRIWSESDDQIFLQEEREKELEEIYESTLLESLEEEKPRGDKDEDEDVHASEATRAGKQTIESLKSGELIMEALDIGIADLDALEQYEKDKKKALKNKQALPQAPTRNIILEVKKISAQEYVFQTVSKIKSAQLEDALIILPFSKVVAMFRFIEIWTKEGYEKLNIELICRVLFFMVRVHSKEISSNKLLRPTLESIRPNLVKTLKAQRDEIGVNIQGLKYIKEYWNMYHKKEFVDEYEQIQEEEKNSRKRIFSTV